MAPEDPPRTIKPIYVVIACLCVVLVMFVGAIAIAVFAIKSENNAARPGVVRLQN